MLIKTNGIVLRSIKYSETSIIADIYTLQKGLQSFIISGVRKRNASTSAGLLQLMSQVEVVAYFKEGKGLNRIKELKPAYIYERIPFDIVKGTIGLFMVEVAQKSIKEAESNPPLFDFLIHSFQSLDGTTKGVANIHLVFLAKLATLLGFTPSGQYDTDTPFFDLKEGYFVAEEPLHFEYMKKGSSADFSILLDLDYENASDLKLNQHQRRALLDKVIAYYQYHIEGFGKLNSYEILKEVF